MSTPSNPPAAVAMTRVKVSKGATTTDLSSKLAVDVPADKKTASDLRVSLAAEGFMKNTDVFLTSPDNFPLSKGSEPNTQWSTLVAADGSIGVLTPPAKTAENLALPPLPTSKDFWDPKLGGGTLLPTLPTTRVGEAQSISELKNAADLGIEEWLYLIKLNGLFGGIRLGDACVSMNQLCWVLAISVISAGSCFVEEVISAPSATYRDTLRRSFLGLRPLVRTPSVLEIGHNEDINHLILEVTSNGKVIDKVDLLSSESTPDVWRFDTIMILYGVDTELMICVYMGINGTERQLLGFVELNKQEICHTFKQRIGM
ncbi:hypothetical protein CPB86DRAFT_799680 [Serendipita vermifera]|nr:hypothetical protein CPB86DRAFT_799680 [Serendipita vermifera]